MSNIGSDLARSLVEGLGADCGVAAALARLISTRRGDAVDLGRLSEWPTGSVLRVAADFARRGWLTPAQRSWVVGPNVVPAELSSFLEGAFVMRASLPDDGRATAVVTMPPAPSVIGTALPATGIAHAALVPTQIVFERIATTASTSFTIMTPFLNDDGVRIALHLFQATQAKRRCLIIRRSGSAKVVVERVWDELARFKVDVLDYTLPVGAGYETFHAKVLLADQDLAYVGSANMTAFARHSMELGILADGRAARVVSSVVRAVERIAVKCQAPSSLKGS